MKVRLITFDVTNTLLKFRTSPGQMYAKVGSMYGVEAHPSNLNDAFRKHWKTMNEERPNFGAHPSDSKRREKSTSAAVDWWRTMVDRTFQSSGTPLDTDQLHSISSHLFKSYSTGACWEVRPGTLEVLSSLRQREGHFWLGVISNFDYRLHDVLADTGLVHFFDFVVASYDVGLYKPQPDIFDLALKKCNACVPQTYQRCTSADACHIGDDFELDYLAARAAGWNAFLLRHGEAAASEENTVEPAQVIGDIREVVGRMQH